MSTLVWILFIVALVVAAVGFMLIRQRQRGGDVYASRSASQSEVQND